jgi:hypothetical protein
MKYHDRPEKCPHCDRRFGTVTHLRRHVNDVHETTEKYFCTVENCKYAKKGDQQMFFSRKDNWRRHLLRHKREDESGPSQHAVEEEVNIGPSQGAVDEEVEIESQADEIEMPKSVNGLQGGRDAGSAQPEGRSLVSQ